MFETIKRMFKEEEIKDIASQFDEDHSGEIRRRLIKLHEELKRVCEDNGIMMVDYYNFYDLMLGNPALYMVFDLEAFIIEIMSYPEKYRKELKDGAEHKIVYSYPGTFEKIVTVAMCARLMTEEEIMQRKFLKDIGIEE